MLTERLEVQDAHCRELLRELVLVDDCGGGRSELGRLLALALVGERLCRRRRLLLRDAALDLTLFERACLLQGLRSG